MDDAEGEVVGRLLAFRKKLKADPMTVALGNMGNWEITLEMLI